MSVPCCIISNVCLSLSAFWFVCMYVCVHTSVRTHTCTHACTHIHTQSVHICTYMHTHIDTHKHTHTFIKINFVLCCLFINNAVLKLIVIFVLIAVKRVLRWIIYIYSFIVGVCKLLAASITLYFQMGFYFQLLFMALKRNLKTFLHICVI